MKLFWSTRSPFARKVVIFAHESGLIGRVECCPTLISRAAPSERLAAHNPLAQLPTLLTDDGVALFDSAVICDYLDSQHDGPKLIPERGAARWAALTTQALADGLLEGLVVLRQETARTGEARQDALIGGLEHKRTRALDAFARLSETLETSPFGIAQISVGCALAYLDFRFENVDWRAARPGLSRWFAAFSARPSVQATAFSDTR